MAGHKALGRGLEALFASTKSQPKPSADEQAGASTSGTAGGVRDIAIGQIKPNRHQPRTHFDEAALQELADSIKQHGLAQPILVTETVTAGEYELVAGERRLRAAKLAGLATIPCTIKKLSHRQRFEVALVENLQRQDLNALEEATALDGLMKEYSLTQDQVASAIGKSRSTVANILRFLRLHENVQAALRSGQISEGHAKILAGVPEHAEQLRWMDKIIKSRLSVRDLEALVYGGKPSKKSAANRPRNVSPDTARYEEEFQRKLGRQIEIQSNGQKGWLKLAFYSPEDFEEMCRKLGLLA